MIEKDLRNVQDQETQKMFKHVFENAQGSVMSLTGTPAADVPLLKSGEMGVYGGFLYSRTGNTIYVFTPSSTITVTA